MTLRESIARRAHSPAERKVAIALGLSAFGASSGSEVPPPREWPPNGSSGDRSASSVIGLCSREARTSENGPPRVPAAAGRRPAGPGFRARARAGGWERRGAPPRRRGRPQPRRGAGERARARTAAASPTGPRSSTQSPHHAKSRQNRTDRACTDARPRLQPPVPTPDSSPALSPPPSASPRWSTHRSQIRHQSTHHPRPCPVAAAPPPAHQHPPGLTPHVYLAGRGRGVRREAADPPSSLSPGGKPRKHPKAGRRPVALRGETHGTKQMEGNKWRETHGGNRVPSVVGFSYSRRRLCLPEHSTHEA